jgi:tripartite ATP-independent transporter DctM subunit
MGVLETGMLMFVLLVVLLLIGVPVAVVLGSVSLAWILISGMPLRTMASAMYGNINLFVLMAIPFFIMAGEVMNKTGITDRLMTFANMIVGRFRGGMAQANIYTSLLFAGITGAAISDVSALGSVYIPAMEKQGYTRSFSAMITAASSIVGPIIPPSIVIVIYGSVTTVSIGGMFTAAIIPGFIIGISQSILVGVMGKRWNLPKVDVKFDGKEFFQSFKAASLAVIMPVIIIGGILGGIFTPTEAAAVAVLYALVLGFFVYRTLHLRDLMGLGAVTLRISATLYFIIGVAGALGWIIARVNLPKYLAEFFLSLSDNPSTIFVLVMILMMFVGTWLENGPAIVILAPILAPMMESVGVHPLHFGTLMIISLCVGLITPPLGVCLFAASSVGKVKFEAIVKEIWPFIIVDCVVIVLLIYVPSLTLYLPKVFGFM